MSSVQQDENHRPEEIGTHELSLVMAFKHRNSPKKKGQLQNFRTLVCFANVLVVCCFSEIDLKGTINVCISIWVRVIARQSLTAESEYRAHVPSEISETSFV